MAAMRIDCVMQFKCCDRTGQCSDTVGQRGFTVNSRKHCHISTTDFCDTLKQAPPAGKVRVGCWVPMSKLHFIKTGGCSVISSHITVHWRKAVKIFLDSFLLSDGKRKLMPFWENRRKKSHNCWTQFHATVRYKKNIPSNFHQTVAAMMNFNWTNIFSTLLGNHHRATNVYKLCS